MWSSQSRAEQLPTRTPKETKKTVVEASLDRSDELEVKEPAPKPEPAKPTPAPGSAKPDPEPATPAPEPEPTPEPKEPTE